MFNAYFVSTYINSFYSTGYVALHCNRFGITFILAKFTRKTAIDQERSAVRYLRTRSFVQVQADA
jgi:hypothetical protein